MSSVTPSRVPPDGLGRGDHRRVLRVGKCLHDLHSKAGDRTTFEPLWLSYRPAVDDIEIRFTEREVAQILWVLSEAADRAHEAHALSDVALIEDTLRMVRDRFDRRRPE